MFSQLLTLLTLLTISSNQSPPSIYQTLKSNGLPMGLLPNGITNFSYNEQTGSFEVHLEQECNAKFENELHYDTNVTGVITYGQISELSGISAQDLFLWFPVKIIYVDVPSTGLIYFDVGVVSKQFSLSMFDTPRDCTASQPIQSSVDGAKSKNLAGHLRYWPDQGNIQRAVLRRSSIQVA